MCTLQIIVYFVSFPDLSDENDKSHKMFEITKEGRNDSGRNAWVMKVRFPYCRVLRDPKLE